MAPEGHLQPAALWGLSVGGGRLGARLHGTDVAIDALLPLAAVALGPTAIGIVFAIENAATGGGETREMG
jgi:hypothetical protein